MEENPDLVLHGGTVYSFDDPTPGAAGTRAEAIACRAGTIVALGTSRQVLALAGPATQVIDLAGSTVIPGINDAHLHGAWLGARWPSLFFGDESTAPTGRLLSNATERAAALQRSWALLSSLGITSYTEPGIGPGEDDGETGCFGSAMLDSYLELAGSAQQTVRVTLLRLFGLLDGPSTLDGFRAGLDVPTPPTDSRWLAIPGVKIFADGIPPMHGAWTTTPYPDGSTGALMTEGGAEFGSESNAEASRLAAFTRMIELADSRGLQIAVHATGDRTIDAFLTAIERRRAAGAASRDGHRDAGHPAGRAASRAGEAAGDAARAAGPHYVVHGDLVTPAQIARLARLGMGLDVQPLIAAHTRDWLSERVSPQVAAAAWPLADLLESSVATSLTSDAPIATPDWRQTIAAAAALLESRGVAVTREHRARFVQMYTSVPAAQDGAAGWKGTLAPGMAADLCVLTADPLETEPADLPAVEIELTVVDGRIVYTRAGADTLR
ncbi:amidohydrolase [Subtercola sp. YIM 133946]|uniref:amidohydrolase n=1 Tax=Subtercola sp. YIM 133946 TaxID=3118909 RepID=UPI002F95BC72